jgi:uncharacterized repeat protein (TIGR03803 family)
LHAFSDKTRDAACPCSGLIFDAAGNLYGTSIGGGFASGGTVFELTPDTSGFWKETVLYSFGSAGFLPLGVTLDAAGNLYGATSDGGIEAWGTVFEIIH